jgi:hypothetical protein
MLAKAIVGLAKYEEWNNAMQNEHNSLIAMDTCIESLQKRKILVFGKANQVYQKREWLPL